MFNSDGSLTTNLLTNIVPVCKRDLKIWCRSLPKRGNYRGYLRFVLLQLPITPHLIASHEEAAVANRFCFPAIAFLGDWYFISMSSHRLSCFIPHLASDTTPLPRNPLVPPHSRCEEETHLNPLNFLVSLPPSSLKYNTAPQTPPP